MLDAALLSSEAKPGDHLSAEAEVDIDGILISAVAQPKSRSGKDDGERLEIIGGSNAGGVTTQLAKKGKKSRRQGDRNRDDSDRGDRGDRGRGDRGRGDRGDRGRDDRTRGDRDDSAGDDADNKRRKRNPRSGDSAGGERSGRRSEGGSDRRSEGGSDRRSGRGSDRRSDGRSGRGSDRRSDRSTRHSAASKDEEDLPRTPKAPRLRPRQAHRKEFIESLPAEQQVLAEQLQKGGIAAVRDEIKAQNEQAEKSDGKKIKAEELLALSEKLLPKLREAEWRDRADAALAGIDKTDLRDIRAVLVAAEDFARSREARELTEQIRTQMAARLDRSQTEWHDELRKVVAAGRVVRALRLSSHPPKPGVPLPPDLAKDLTEQANAALGTGNSQQRLAVVLDAVAYSPIRPYVVLSNVPTTPEADLVEAVTKIATRIPEIAKQLGIEPPAKRKGRRSGRKIPPPDVPGPDATADPGSDPAADPVPDKPIADKPESSAADAAEPESPGSDPAADSVPDKPIADKPIADKPESPAPDVAEPDAAESDAAEPDAAEPESPAPDAPDPDAAEPSVAAPEAAAEPAAEPAL